MTQSLQDTYAPNNACFGCGPANEKGLRIKSLPVDDTDPQGDVVCQWMPESHHQAFEGMLNGGIIGSLLDCHCNWTAAWHQTRRDELDTPPCTVTAEYHVVMRKPTPSGRPVLLAARVIASEGPKVTVESELSSDGVVTATCTGLFVAVKPGHPAYSRW